MISPEQLISDLNKEIESLKKELEEAQQDIRDFEDLAKVWKKSYGEMEAKYKVKLANADQVIEQLEEELKDWKPYNDYE